MASVKPKPRVANNSTKRKDKPTSTGGSLKGKDKPSKSSSGVQKKPKTKSTSFKDAPKRKKRRQYTEKELDIQKLNMITPAGVQKPKGKKKGKVFVDDQESMMTLLAMVNAEKEGQIESKMARSRQMEEIRQARQQEMEKRQTEKKAKLVSELCMVALICR